MSTQEAPRMVIEPEVKKKEIIPHAKFVTFLRNLATDNYFEREGNTLNYIGTFPDPVDIHEVVRKIETFFGADSNVDHYGGHAFKEDIRDDRHNTAIIMFKKPVRGIHKIVMMLKYPND